MEAAFFQFSPKFGDIRGNVERSIGVLSSLNADLVVLPELFNTGYQFSSGEEAEKLSEEVPSGFTSRSLSGLSQEKGFYIVAGLAERDGDRIYNSAVLTGPRGFMGVYRKAHLYSEEKLWFTPGDTGFRIWDTPAGRIGIMICFDWFFPESTRTLALKGAQIIAHPSNLVLPYCPDAMVTRCLENRVFAVTANRTGTEERAGKGPLRYIGSSEIVSPSGRILYRASADNEETGHAEIDVGEAGNKKINSFNDIFEDRRKDLYYD
ncbi:MAG: nitrilase-related carbon-nitrogen hydrolase [Candidatus Sulfobium sp.]|jgi:predicted amidohydrolase